MHIYCPLRIVIDLIVSTLLPHCNHLPFGLDVSDSFVRVLTVWRHAPDTQDFRQQLVTLLFNFSIMFFFTSTPKLLLREATTYFLLYCNNWPGSQMWNVSRLKIDDRFIYISIIVELIDSFENEYFPYLYSFYFRYFRLTKSWRIHSEPIKTMPNQSKTSFQFFSIRSQYQIQSFGFSKWFKQKLNYPKVFQTFNWNSEKSLYN